MAAQLFDCKGTAAAVKAELAERVSVLKAAGITPGLATLLVGDDPASHAYVGGKHRDCHEVGIESIRVDLPATASQADVEQAVRDLNASTSCTGYIVQLPLPKGLDERPVLEAMDPAKDADGLHPANLGQLASQVAGEITTPLPCTPHGVMEVLRRHDIALSGAEVCVIGRSVLVGRSIALMLNRKDANATVTMCHTGTKNIAEHTKRADIIVAAVGVPAMLTPDMVRPGAVVVDVGINRIDDPEKPKGRLVGDVHPDVAEVAGWLTPVPGGIGLMTRAMLLANVVTMAERQAAQR